MIVQVIDAVYVYTVVHGTSWPVFDPVIIVVMVVI